MRYNEHGAQIFPKRSLFKKACKPQNTNKQGMLGVRQLERVRDKRREVLKWRVKNRQRQAAVTAVTAVQ